MKSLDRKLARIRAGDYTPQDFIIADAKDADMAFGLTAPGPVRDAEGRFGAEFASRAVYLDAIRSMTRSGLVDIMLTSASTAEILAAEGLYADSDVTPAVRYNDTTDIWYPRGGRYGSEPSHPFRSARLSRVRRFADLGLYSVTFSNDIARDLVTLEAYSAFRAEAAELGARHFLEVFNPAFDIDVEKNAIGDFIGDSIVRLLAGVVGAEQPIFLKIVYNGRRAMETLAAYDPERLVVGILGGTKGTTRDTFELISRGERAGARVALFGRKINLAQSPLDLVRLMRAVVARELSVNEAVRAYHGALQDKGIIPALPLAEDIEISDPQLKEDN
jgi:DhnA family fructose-bisphosphate aldolase class Ia